LLFLTPELQPTKQVSDAAEANRKKIRSFGKEHKNKYG
jgi:hypothetical protein